jgi:predicted transcriptional regulator
VGEEATERVALLSIHPHHANAILAGEKRVEFRTRRLAEDIRLVLIYATQPTSAIVGWFEVGETVRASPTRLWLEYRSTGCISRADYRRYFAGRRFGFGIEVRNASRMRPTPLSKLRSTLRPPQFVKYLNREDLHELL